MPNPPAVTEIANINFGYVQAGIARALIEAYPRGLKMPALVAKVYTSAAQEPEHAANSLQVIIANMRPTLERAGWSIPKTGKGNREATYRLVPLE